MKLPYFKLGDDLMETRLNLVYGGLPDTLKSAAKLVGKTAANVGLLAVEAGVGLAKMTPEIIGSAAKQSLAKNSARMTSEQKEWAEGAVTRGVEARERRAKKEREEREEGRRAEGD